MAMTTTKNDVLDGNSFGITEDEREGYHPVVVFPTKSVRVESNNEKDGGTTKVLTREVPSFRLLHQSGDGRKSDRGTSPYTVGKYNEHRPGLYVQDMFEDEGKEIDGYPGARTVHVAIDLGGPVGENVHAFTEGVIHSAGYNSADGDYGNVIVVEHWVGARRQGRRRPDDGGCGEGPYGGEEESMSKNKVWALYGHLDKGSIVGKVPGQPVARGEVLGRLGDKTENGGWSAPHVHFQLSITSPKTHDMPGVVSLADREAALKQYPDPRIVLGMLYQD